jgi:hypothetical protein
VTTDLTVLPFVVKRRCCVSGCPREDTTLYLPLIGGEEVEAPMCPPHAAEYRCDEIGDPHAW